MLRERLSVAAVIQEDVTLVAQGAVLRGRCTAHDDQQRSLFVRDVIGLYHCYACGRGGDVVQWTRDILRCDEEAAIAHLLSRIASENSE